MHTKYDSSKVFRPFLLPFVTDLFQTETVYTSKEDFTATYTKEGFYQRLDVSIMTIVEISDSKITCANITTKLDFH
jgi:hypothetical protein